LTVVSVTMSTYNRNDLLFERSLPSVLAQTHRELDVHIVNDGMRGPELEELEQRITELPRMPGRSVHLWRVVRQSYPDDPATRWMVLGLNARNHALDHATGEWIASLDDDDEWTPDHIEVLLRAALGAEADFAYGRSEYHWPDGRQQFAGVWPPGVGAFCDGAQLYRNGMGYRYDPGCVERGLPEDGDMWERMRDGGVKFTFLPQLIHHYYPNPR
jgi:glycosyltransferase involved in cell wall biosynthesis